MNASPEFNLPLHQLVDRDGNPLKYGDRVRIIAEGLTKKHSGTGILVNFRESRSAYGQYGVYYVVHTDKPGRTIIGKASETVKLSPENQIDRSGRHEL